MSPTPNRPRNLRQVHIVGPFPAGTLVPRPSVDGHRPKDQRWMNWAVNQETGKPYGAPIDCEVALDPHIVTLLASGLVREVPAAAPPAAKKEKA